MALIKGSSFEDSIDRFNHTWLVVFLLILAALTFFIPFGLPLTGKVAPGGRAVRTETSSKYTSNCWCPAHFTNSMIDYTNAACAAAFARAQSKKPSIDSDRDQSPATVYQISSGLGTTPIGPNVSETITDEDADDSAYDFILEYTPLFMFVAAVVFKFAHSLFVIFISSYGVNLGNLAETWRSLSLDVERRGQQAFLNDLSEKINKSHWLSCRYLAYKLVICILCAIVAVVIYCVMLQGVYLLLGNDQNNVDQPRSESAKRMCDLSIVTGGTTHAYTIQCMFTNTVQSEDHSRRVQFYKPFYTALLFAFVIITLVNAINWTMWAVKLCCRQSSNLSLDARLLVCLVAEHGYFTASERLENGLLRLQKGSDPNVEFVKETEDL